MSQGNRRRRPSVAAAAALLAIVVVVARVDDFVVGGRTVSSLLVRVVDTRVTRRRQLPAVRGDVAVRSFVMRAFCVRPSVGWHSRLPRPRIQLDFKLKVTQTRRRPQAYSAQTNSVIRN